MKQSKSFAQNTALRTELCNLVYAGRCGVLASAGFLLAGCIGVSQQKADPSAPSEDALAACPNGFAPAADGNIDDFEDGNRQGTPEGGRDGSWYTAADPNGSSVELPPSDSFTVDGGADGSASALRFKGKTSGASGAWGVELGLNMKGDQSEQYDASKYKALSFKAKSGAKEAEKKVRVAFGDVNTDPSGNVCQNCYNHFSSNIELTPDWKEYVLAFDDTRQRPGWGNPRPAALTASKLVKISFQIEGGKEFDLWLDDMKFLECKP